MPATATSIDASDGDRLARRNVLVLAIAQALAGSTSTIFVATGGIVGAMLAPDKGLATVPITVMVIGIWLGTLPVGALAKKYGRRFALEAGSAVGILGGLISSWAVLQGSFALFLLGSFCAGVYGASYQSYRFAATDTASDGFKPKAISYVLAGGVLAGVIGPSIVIFTKDLWQPHLFAATFIAQSAVAALAGLVLMRFKSAPLISRAQLDLGRPLGEIARNPRFIVAVVVGVASYTMMNLVMTSAPLAMVGCGHSITQATLGIQWHVLGMFAPSFITGSLIVRFGVNRIVICGLGLILVSAMIGLSGISVAHFWISLTLLGVGWNFAFIGATTIVTQCHRPEERNKVQAFNDFLIFGSMAIGSFSSGKLLATLGWEAVNGVVFPPILAAAALLLWLAIRERRRTAS